MVLVKQCVLFCLFYSLEKWTNKSKTVLILDTGKNVREISATLKQLLICDEEAVSQWMSHLTSSAQVSEPATLTSFGLA